MSATISQPTEQTKAATLPSSAAHAALLTLARAMGRQAAREDIARHQAATVWEKPDAEAL